MTGLSASGPVRHACIGVSQRHHGATHIYTCGQYQPAGNDAKDTSLTTYDTSIFKTIYDIELYKLGSNPTLMSPAAKSPCVAVTSIVPNRVPNFMPP